MNLKFFLCLFDFITVLTIHGKVLTVHGKALTVHGGTLTIHGLGCFKGLLSAYDSRFLVMCT